MTGQAATVNDRLERQLAFVREVDKLKHVFRRTWLLDGSRLENDAEHSWHLALMTVLLFEYAADENLDVLRVLKMVVVHDLVEIDAGDTYAYDSAGRDTQSEREIRAADRIFSLLPADQGPQLRALWDEFEARETPEAPATPDAQLLHRGASMARTRHYGRSGYRPMPPDCRRCAPALAICGKTHRECRDARVSEAGCRWLGASYRVSD